MADTKEIKVKDSDKEILSIISDKVEDTRKIYVLLNIKDKFTKKERKKLGLKKLYAKTDKVHEDLLILSVSKFTINETNYDIELELEDKNLKKIILNNEKIKVLNEKSESVFEIEMESGDVNFLENEVMWEYFLETNDMMTPSTVEVARTEAEEAVATVEAVETVTVEAAETEEVEEAAIIVESREEFTEGSFALPVYEQQGVSRTKIGHKKSQYSKEENVFEYITSRNKKLMKVYINKSSDGQTEKILELDNSDNKFDAFKKIVEKDADVGSIKGDKIYVKIEDIIYKPTSEITVSFNKDIEDEGVKYKSIDVLSNSVILSGKGKKKPIYAAEENEIINQVLPSNFFELFASDTVKGKTLPAQQLGALIELSKEGKKLPEGVLKASEYEIGNRKLNVLLLQDHDSSGKPIKKLFAQMGTEVVQIDTIYRIPDQKTDKGKKDSINLLFGATINKTSNDMGAFKKVHRIEGINENTEEFKKFQTEILENNELSKEKIDFKYEEDFTKDENRLISPTKRIVRDKMIVNQRIDREEKELNPEDPNPVDPDPEPKDPDQEDPGPKDPKDPINLPPKKRRFSKFLRFLKYALYTLGAAALISLGVMTASIGLVPGLTLAVLGANLFQGLASSIAADIKKDTEAKQGIDSESLKRKIKDLEQEISELKQKQSEKAENKEQVVNQEEKTEEKTEEKIEEKTEEKIEEKVIEKKPEEKKTDERVMEALGRSAVSASKEEEKKVEIISLDKDDEKTIEL